MGLVKTVERSSKRGLMRALGYVFRARPLTAQQVMTPPPRRILVVRQHNQMGDMLLATPAFRAVKETLPECDLTVLTAPINRGVLLSNPHVDRVLTFDKRNPIKHASLLHELRKGKFDLAIVLHTVSFSFTSLMMLALSGARRRVGSTLTRQGDLSGSFLNMTLPLPAADELSTMNEAEHNLFPLRTLGITTDNLAPVLEPSQSSLEWAKVVANKLWSEGATRLLVHPGAGKTENIWPTERFGEVVKAVAREVAIEVVTPQGPADAASVAAFVASCPSNLKPQVVVGEPIDRVAALMREADLVLCNDTGVMHVAAAAGAHTLAIFGPTDPLRWAPRSPSLHTVRAPGGVLASLSAAEVAGAVLERLANAPTRR